MNTTFETDIDTKKRCVKTDFDRNDDFWEKHATAITGNELRQRMYQRIDAWKWSEK